MTIIIILGIVTGAGFIWSALIEVEDRKRHK